MTLIDMLRSYENNPDIFQPSLADFLNRITCISRDEDADSDGFSQVNLMTIHSAKGLEFQVVFLAGVEENIIPHARALDENEKNIEEERRLFYVAITRARSKLFLTSCLTRRFMRETLDCNPSPFLDELPQELITPAEHAGPVNPEEAGDFFTAIKSQFK